MTRILRDGKQYETFQMFCQKCGKEVFPKDFRTPESMREFLMWNECQDCQDREALEAYKESKKHGE